MTARTPFYVIRQAGPEHIPGMIALSAAVYPWSAPWSERQLRSHQDVFPQGQFVAVDRRTDTVVGMAASLIIYWDDYDLRQNWRDFTAAGMFTNHDPARGRTLYGAEVIVHPHARRGGVGSRLYEARRGVVERLGLLRIRAGARLRGYHVHAKRMTAEEYAVKVVRGELKDATLSFQLRWGFEVIGVVSQYLQHDPESLGYAAIIEWLNPAVATTADFADRPVRYARPRAAEPPPASS